ncbi:hypothetical protein ABIB27_001092 [Arthrobacter sp. UYEF21]
MDVTGEDHGVAVAFGEEVLLAQDVPALAFVGG